jgi:hypothetical protein
VEPRRTLHFPSFRVSCDSALRYDNIMISATRHEVKFGLGAWNMPFCCQCLLHVWPSGRFLDIGAICCFLLQGSRPHSLLQDIYLFLCYVSSGTSSSPSSANLKGSSMRTKACSWAHRQKQEQYLSILWLLPALLEHSVSVTYQRRRNDLSGRHDMLRRACHMAGW